GEQPLGHERHLLAPLAAEVTGAARRGVLRLARRWRVGGRRRAGRGRGDAGRGGAGAGGGRAGGGGRGGAGGGRGAGRRGGRRARLGVEVVRALAAGLESERGAVVDGVE